MSIWMITWVALGTILLSSGILLAAMQLIRWMGPDDDDEKWIGQ